MIKRNRTTILNKIKSKQLIFEKIFPFLLNRPCILSDLILNDSTLKDKLYNIFSKINKTNNRLGKEFCNNLEFYSSLKDINNKISKWFNHIKNKSLNYDFLENVLNFSYIQYLYNSLLHLKQKKHYENLNQKAIKSTVIDFYSSLPNIIAIFSPKNEINLENEYFKFIETANNNSRNKNKINQKIKLIMIISPNISEGEDTLQKISYNNINEIEIFFDIKNYGYENLYIVLNNYFSKIEFLENINKINFNNLININYFNESIYIKKEKKLYQSLLSYLFDEYYYFQEKQDNKDKKNQNQFKLIKNLENIYIENITFLYIYEKMKLFYCINDIFPIISNKNDSGILYYLYDNLLIINNKSSSLKIKDLVLFINQHIKNNNIKYLLIINHNTLIKDEKNNNEIKIDIPSNFKEFMFISDGITNICNKGLIDIFLLSNKEDIDNNIYEGYDTNNNLIFYRQGKACIQSFDLIDLFKYNKNLVLIKLIKEKIDIKYNNERTKLEIINLNKKKNELNEIININNYMAINYFSQFIFNQKYLNELVIVKFDLDLKDISNLNIKILKINYEKDISIMKYKIENKLNKGIKIFFPKLIHIYTGGDINWFLNLQKSELPNELKSIKIISKYINNNKIFKKIKKFKKIGKNIDIEFLENEEENKDNEYINEEFDEVDEYGEDYKETIIKNDKLSKSRKNETENGSLKNYIEYHCIGCLKDKIKGFKEYSQKYISIMDKSIILTEYKKKSNLKVYNNVKYRIDCDLYNLNEYKLLYKASGYKCLEKSIKIINNLKTNNFILIIKTSINLYIVRNHFNTYILSFDKFDLFGGDYILSFNEDNIYFKDDYDTLFIFEINIAKGYFLGRINESFGENKKKIYFDILDFELFKIIKNKKDTNNEKTFLHFLDFRKKINEENN